MPYNIIIGRDEEDKKRFGDKGAVFLGRTYVKMGQTTSLANNLFLDVVRPHVILVSGRRGSGKCLLGDTIITLADGSVKQIKELENDNNLVYSLNDKLKVTKTKKSEFFKRKVDKILYLKLRSGKEIKLTPEHPLLTIKGWKPAQELIIGSRIATPREINNFGNEDLENYKIKILAYLIAEGHTRKSWVLFSTADQDMLKEFTDCINKFDEKLQISIHSKSMCYRVANRNNRYTFRKNSIKSWLKSLGIYGYYSKEKWIPECIFKLPKEKLALFLNRLFSCDGSIYSSNNHYEISYSSSSEKLIRQIQSLLLRFRILSKLRKKTVKCNSKLFETFELDIESENITRFIEEIGFYGKKHEREQPALNFIKKRKTNPNVDTIPKEIWDLYRPKNFAEVGRAIGYSIPKALWGSTRYSPSRQKLMQIAKVDCNEAIYNLATSDIFWDEIVSMELLDGEFEVYDICVPEFHNFIANDIIVHNSYSLSVIAESIAQLPKEVNENLSVLIFDTMGIFWTMKFPNKRQEKLLEEWGLNPEGIKVNVFTPAGYYENYKKKGIPTDYKFSIKTSELSAGDWCDTLNINIIDPVGLLVSRTIESLKGKNYSIQDIINELRKDKKADEKTKDAAESMFLTVDKWGLFDAHGTEINELAKPGKVSILDVSCYTEVSAGWSVKALVIGLISRKLLRERITSRKVEELNEIKYGMKYTGLEAKKELPQVWIMIDEVHKVLSKYEKTPATEDLIRLLREGRQPGISLILATQQPGIVHQDVITQSDIVISHRVTAKVDIDALNNIMQTYLTKDLISHINDLPKLKGSAIVLDDNSERIYPMRVRPKKSWHGGEAPTAVKISKKEELEEL